VIATLIGAFHWTGILTFDKKQLLSTDFTNNTDFYLRTLALFP